MRLLRCILFRQTLVLAAFVLFAGALPAAGNSPGNFHWTADWIWPSTSAIPSHRNQFVLFRKTFTLASVPTNARLAIFADSRYRLYLNGSFIGQGPARSPHYWFYYDVFDVASQLHAGRNVIAVEVRWYGQNMAWYVPPYPTGIPGYLSSVVHGALLCQLNVAAGGQEQTVKSDTSWKAIEDHAWDWNTPRVNGSLAGIEVYHTDREVKGWTAPAFDDSNWVPVVTLNSFFSHSSSPPLAPYTHLVPRPMAYPVQREVTPAKVVSAGVFPSQTMRGLSFAGRSALSALGREMAQENNEPRSAVLQDANALTSSSLSATAEIQPTAPGQVPYVILDLGREMDGYLQFSVESPQAAVMDIGWSEMMIHGDITADEPGGNYVAQYWISPGSQHWTMWGWHAMRFVEVSFPTVHAPLRFRVSLRFSTAKLDHAGSFESSSPLLTKLWQMGAYTFQLCTLDGTMDCPTREQHQWLGDGEIELRVNSVANGTLDITRKFLLDAARDQWRDGAIPMVSDMGGNSTMLIDSYVFSFINALHAYYEQTGDRAFVERLYPSVARAMMWFQGFRQPRGLLGRVPYWNFLDWSNPDSHGESSILNALYAHTLDNAAELAGVAGDAFHARIFRADSARIHAIFNQRFWNAGLGLYVDAWHDGRQSAQLGQLANADAVNYGFAPNGRVADILDKITDPARIEQQRLNPQTSQFVTPATPPSPAKDIVQAQTYGTYFVLSALAKYGRARAAREIIERLWGPMAKVGNDTFWENFVQSAGTSCHAWSAAPTYFLTALILGVRPTKPGYSQYSLAPHPAGLEWAKGTVPTVHGPIRVSWQWSPPATGGAGQDPATFRITLDNPSGETAIVTMPKRNGEAPASVTLDGKAVSGQVQVSRQGDHSLEARYR